MITQLQISELKSARNAAANMAKSAKTMEKNAAEIAGGLQGRLEAGETVERGELSLQIETKVSSPRVSWKSVAAQERGIHLGHELTEPEVKSWTERLLQGIAGKASKVLKVLG